MIYINDLTIALDVFPDKNILDGLVDMLLFNCLTGNNDKGNHFQLIEYLKENQFIKEKHIAKWTSNERIKPTTCGIMDLGKNI